MHLPHENAKALYTFYNSLKKKAFQSIIILIWPVSVITKNKIIMLIEPMDYTFFGINDFGQIRKGEVALFELQYLTE